MRIALLTLLLLSTGLAGCIGTDDGSEAVQEQSVPDLPIDPGLTPVTAHTPTGVVPDDALPDGLVVPQVLAKAIGERGPEPTMGVTSDGTLFFVASTKVMRSQDHGQSWEVVHELVTTLDPMLWVDPVTDRVFVDHLYVGCSYLAWSDDLGETWTQNPVACGVPVNDHQKVATMVDAGTGPLSPTAVYPNFVYYAYNGLAAGSRISISLDGGLTFPYNAETVPPNHPNSCSGGLHGHPAPAPDGSTLYLPKRSCDGVLVALSRDAGFTWEQVLVGENAGAPDCRKNPEVAVGSDNAAYVVWPGEDQELYLASSVDDGATWTDGIKISPPEMEVTVMPVAAAGDGGRLAVAYYGIESSQTEDADPDRVNETGRWHLYMAMSTNALDAEPTFVTVQVTPDEDPIQIGPISTNSDCDNPPGSRNLLDFIDMVMDQEGRVYVAYADGCTGGCAGEPDATMEDSRSADGYVAVVGAGTSLVGSVGLLEPLSK